MDTRQSSTSGDSQMPPSAQVPSYAASRANSLPANIVPGTGRRQSSLAAIVLRKRSDLDIILEGGADDFVHSYSTHDEIKGVVEMKFEKDTRMDDFFVTLEGQSATFIEKMATTAATTGRTTGKHTFLRLQQPFDPALLPENGLARGGVTYIFPFTFVVPDRLLPYVCNHRTDNEEVKTAHLRLPPSLGDSNISGDGHILMNDMSPDMAKVSYAVHAKALKRSQTGKMIEVADKTERIRVIPGREEEPLLTIDPAASDYVLRKEKSVKKGLFKIGKIGRLTAETTQPRSLQLPHPQKRSKELITTMTTVNLRFDPQSPEDQPPQLSTIVSKLRIITFFGAAPYKMLPAMHKYDNWSTLHGVYPETIELSSRNLSTQSWTRHDPLSKTNTQSTSSSTDLSRRPSTYSTMSTHSSSIPEPSSLYHPSSPFYTASILVPISLPNPYTSNRPKTFVPTFHSCIVSRIYTLDLNVSYQTPGTSVGNSHIHLKSPIQISSESGRPPSSEMESEDAIVAEIEEQFRLYEARQLEDTLGPESPMYEEVNSSARPAGTRHASLAFGSRHGGGGTDSAPPEYHAGPTFSGGRGPRTQSVSVAA